MGCLIPLNIVQSAMVPLGQLAQGRVNHCPHRTEKRQAKKGRRRKGEAYMGRDIVVVVVEIDDIPRRWSADQRLVGAAPFQDRKRPSVGTSSHHPPCFHLYPLHPLLLPLPFHATFPVDETHPSKALASHAHSTLSIAHDISLSTVEL